MTLSLPWDIKKTGHIIRNQRIHINISLSLDGRGEGGEGDKILAICITLIRPAATFSRKGRREKI